MRPRPAGKKVADKYDKPRSFLSGLRNFFDGNEAAECADEIEETLIEADIDLDIAMEMAEKIRTGKYKSFDGAAAYLKEEFIKRLAGSGGGFELKKGVNAVILTGANGTGKTSTASKLAFFLRRQGKKVIFAAADTFRAAADEQLREWAVKTGVEAVSAPPGADPASVVFDAAAKAKKESADAVIVDTAGRLHTNANLMNELIKIKKVTAKTVPEENIESLITIDANTGKNAAAQAEKFNEAVSLTGAVLTKFDSSARGGSVIKISSALSIPVKFITFGEKMEDIDLFDPRKFAGELFG